MDVVVWILILLILFSFLLKQTFWSFWAVCATAIVAGGFALLVWPLAIEQSKNQIAAWLQNQSMMLDTSVILTIEVALHLAFCFLKIHVDNVQPIKKKTRITWIALYWFPGLLILPVLFLGLTQLIFALPGVSFQLLAALFSVAILIVIPLGRYIIRLVIPESELRLEMLFLTNALIAIVGIIATVNGSTAAAGTMELDLPSFLGAIGLFLVVSSLGLLIRKRYKRYIK